MFEEKHWKNFVWIVPGLAYKVGEFNTPATYETSIEGFVIVWELDEQPILSMEFVVKVIG